MDVLVEFRAGQMDYVDKVLRPDSRKGAVRVAQDDQGMIHFQWQDRSAIEAEKDVIVFPGEAKFEKINRPGSRVFLLKFAEEVDRNLFFWAQEPDAAQDDDYVAAVNNIINAGLEDMEVAAPALEQAEAPAVAATQPCQQQAAAAGGPGGSTVAGGAIQADLLASVLSNIMGGGGGAAAAGQQQQMEVGPSLGEVLKPELIAPLLQSPDMVERLSQYLPEQQRNREAITDLVSSPQFRHQLAVFSHALMTGQLDMAQFGLQGQGFGVLDFLKAIQSQADSEAADQAAHPQQPGGGQPEGQAEGQ